MSLQAEFLAAVRKLRDSSTYGDKSQVWEMLKSNGFPNCSVQDTKSKLLTDFRGLSHQIVEGDQVKLQ